MKPYEPKNRNKIGVKKMEGNKKPNKKRRKDNQTLKKSEKGQIKRKKTLIVIKEKEMKIKVLTHKLLYSTLFYLMLAPW
jgi:hypothetical protein